jgi:hypothetical protein
MTGTNCDKSPTLDMRWIWPNITGKKQLINVKTLKCMKRRRDYSSVIMEQCENTPNSRQNIMCTIKDFEMNIGWGNGQFLHFYNWCGTSYAFSTRLPSWSRGQPQSWSSKEISNTCKTSKDYKGMPCHK